MPSTRKRKARAQSRFIVTPEVIRAIQAGHMMQARKMLDLRPWEWDDGFEPLMIPSGPEYDQLIIELKARLKNANEPNEAEKKK